MACKSIWLIPAMVLGVTAAMKGDDGIEQKHSAAHAESWLPVGGRGCGRKYEGIGGLLNSDAPWLLSFPEPQRSDILDVLFKPQWAGSLQVLKLEVGGDGHSTINTESSHMHTEHDPPSFKRGWVTWLLQEAVRRNPDIRVGGLAWTWPGWTKGSVAKKVSYLTKWCEGIKHNFNVTIDFMGLQNEGAITGGNEQFATALRASLDAAGFTDTIIDCCDGHDFNFLPSMADPDSDFFKAVGALGIHEPLRNAESVPAAAIATGKPIWSSESYTTYSDSNGGGCWARAINWGCNYAATSKLFTWNRVKGNLTRHMAWNLIQSYPTEGSGMNYNGHGLTWAVVPWSGHYIVAPPIWVSAHYTQATQYGWQFLPVGSGSGMLPSGGSYVSLVSPNGCEVAEASGAANEIVDLTMVLQTMEYDMSKCFKDTHPPFNVAAQNVSFTVEPGLLERLRRAGGGGAVMLHARRTQLFAESVVDPIYWVPPELSTNRYFESLPPIAISPTGQFTVQLQVNEILTLTTLNNMHRGDDSPGPDLGLATIPNASAWPSKMQCHALTGYPVDTPIVLGGFPAMDQQGVFEARTSRDNSVTGGTTMQQVVPVECDEWHNGGKYRFPQTFIGPPVNLSTEQGGLVSCDVLPPAFANGWAGIGIGGQATTGGLRDANLNTFAIWPNGSWQIFNHTGTVTPSHGHTNENSQPRWYNLSLKMSIESENPSFIASIDGNEVAHGLLSPSTVQDGMSRLGGPPPGVTGSYHPFVYLASSYSTAAGNTPPPDVQIESKCVVAMHSTCGNPLPSNEACTRCAEAHKVQLHDAGCTDQEVRHACTTTKSESTNLGAVSNAEFKNLCISVSEVVPKKAAAPSPAPPSPGPAPSPSPPGVHGLGLAACNNDDARQLWTFSGEDRGEAGVLKVQSNTTLCLDVLAGYDSELTIMPQRCVGNPPEQQQLWKWDSSTGHLSSVDTPPCKVASHGTNCSMCLDVESHGSKVDLFDCKQADGNQQWSFAPESGASLMKKGKECLALFA